MKRIVGIDLGTTNSSVAVMEGDELFVIPNDRGRRLTPSVVGFTGTGEVLVGEAAKNQAIINAAATIQNVKRDMGTLKTYRVAGRTCSPQEISAFILRKLKQDIEKYLGRSVHEAVITVPAHFSDLQRRATMQAGQLAGFKVRRILNEPTAAALAYAQRRMDMSRIVVYDFGGGTFDVSCLEHSGEHYTVRSCRGNNKLGGGDIDARLVELVRQRFLRESGFDVCGDLVKRRQLREKVEAAKIELSGRESGVVALPFMTAGTSALHLSCEIGRVEFEALIADIVDETVQLTLHAMQEAGFQPSGIDAIILAGGSSRIPLVRRRLEPVFGPAFASRINPDEVVALGAAVYAAKFLEADAAAKLRDVTSYSLGVETEGDVYVPLIGRNSPIPLCVRKTFTTVSDSQQEVEVHILQGEHELASRNHSLGKFGLSGIREAARGKPRICVEFTIDDDGLVKVSARDQQTAAAGGMQVSPLPADRPAARPAHPAALLGALIKRLEAELSSGRIGDIQLRREIREQIAAARNSLSQPDRTGLDQHQAILDTLSKEWEARRTIASLSVHGNH